MRRWVSLFVFMVAALGGSAEAGPELPAANTAIIQNIQSFIAAQRATDGQTCSAQGYIAGSVPHRDCVRDLAARRRAAIEDGLSPAAPGRDI